MVGVGGVSRLREKAISLIEPQNIQLHHPKAGVEAGPRGVSLDHIHTFMESRRCKLCSYSWFEATYSTSGCNQPAGVL